MQENQNTQDVAGAQELIDQESQNPASQTTGSADEPKLKRNHLKDGFRKKGDELDEKQKPLMTKEETVKFYEENLPFMRLQDEYEELAHRFAERRVRTMELQVREVEAIGALSQWKAQQDDAKRKHEHEEKMKAEWDAMTPEQQEEWKMKAKKSINIMEMQAKGEVLYTGENITDVIEFVTGDPHNTIIQDPAAEGKFSFQCPLPNGEFTDMTILPGQTIARANDGGFVISQPA